MIKKEPQTVIGITPQGAFFLRYLLAYTVKKLRKR